MNARQPSGPRLGDRPGRPASQDYPGRIRGDVLGVPIDALDWATARRVLLGWARARDSRCVCICNVHSVVTAGGDDDYRRVIERADMATPDGAPIAWTLRRKGFSSQERINGPDLMWKLCADAEAGDVPIGLHGSTDMTLDLLRRRLADAFPRLKIVHCVSPPFRTLSDDEDRQLVDAINDSGAGFLFVGLGCPKQEMWMAAHRGRIASVMLGVGAAFDFHAGTVSRAPEWMRRSGLEWLHRLLSEPKRLGRRYVVTNTLFIMRTLRGFLDGEHSRR